jgi:hypothetical protein
MFLPVLTVFALLFGAQESPAPAAKPTEHVIGTISALDPAAQTITVKEDKTEKAQTILLGGTKTLIKVPAGAKDLKTATRISASDLAVGDRVDVRGNKPPDAPEKIAARSLVLMSGRELAAVHQAQAAEWQNAAAGVVASADPAAQKIVFTERTAEGPKPVTITASPQTEFTRYSPQTPGGPAPSQFAQIQPGDQIRVIGEKSADGGTITARRIYTGAFRTLNGTISSITPDGSSMVIKNLATKKPITIDLNANSEIQQIPPEMAQMMARRMNPGARQGAQGATHTEAPASGGAAGAGAGAGRAPRSGDISRLIERLPKISLSELKPGNAVVVAGAAATPDNSRMTATHVIAGVEPILQAAPAGQRGGEALGGDWGLGEMSVPQ